MNKREFLKLSGAALGGLPFSQGLLAAEGGPDKVAVPGAPLTNWAGNIRYSTGNVLHPRSVEEAQKLVKGQSSLRALGTRHCFNDIADSTSALLSTRGLDRMVALDPKTRTVTLEGGMSYGQLCPMLHERGFALHNLASLPHISVAGACATGTHGSGVDQGNLSTAVEALEIIRADGSMLEMSAGKDRDVFPGAVVALGALGVAARVTLKVQPTFSMRQDVYLDLPLKQLADHYDAIVSSGYSVSFFTDWRDRRVNQVWIKRRVGDDKKDAQPAEPEFHGAKLATRDVHPIIELGAENCTAQMGRVGPWYDRMPHFRMGFTPSSGKELQSEFFVPRANAVEAILAVERLHEQISPHLQITELRNVAADDLWMSPAYRRSSTTIHFTWKPEWDAVRRLLPIIERELSPFQPRPHWGKLFTMAPGELQSRYEMLPRFKALLQEHDPQGKFRNAFVEHCLYG